MSPPCACGCHLKVAVVGHFRKACRLRITAARGVCKPNVRSASAKRRDIKHNPDNNKKNSKKYSKKHNNKNNKKRQLALRAAKKKTLRAGSIHELIRGQRL